MFIEKIQIKSELVHHNYADPLQQIRWNLTHIESTSSYTVRAITFCVIPVHVKAIDSTSLSIFSSALYWKCCRIGYGTVSTLKVSSCGCDINFLAMMMTEVAFVLQYRIGGGDR